MEHKDEGYVVICTLHPKPLPSVHLNKRFTRIDYTAMCTMKDILEGMAGVLKMSSADLAVETEGGKGVMLDQCLVDFYAQHLKKRSHRIEGKRHRWPPFLKTQRKEIHLKVRHTASRNRFVTCIVVGAGDGRHVPHRTVVQLSNMATFGELIIRARSQGYGAIQQEGPVYGNPGELQTILRDAWVRNGCEVDGTLHIGLAVVVWIPGWFERPLSLVMGPDDAIKDLKRKITSNLGAHPSRQSLSIKGETRRLEDGVSLKECCNAGGEVRPHAGWSELHLELVVKDSLLSQNGLLTVNVNVATDIGTNEPLKVPRRLYSSNEKAWISSTTLPHWRGRGSYSPPPLYVFAPPSPGAFSTKALAQVGGTFANNKIKRRQKKGNSNGKWPVEFFALSPSGRAITLALPEGASVRDAKGQVENHEGVSPCYQRLLWRGNPLEPDNASLHELGVRGGDTLILGYRTARSLPEASTPVVHLKGFPGYSPVSAIQTGRGIHPSDGALTPIYITGNLSPYDEEGKLGWSPHAGFPAGVDTRNSRVEPEHGSTWRGSGRGPTNTTAGNCKRTGGREASRGSGRNGSLPRERGYANAGSRLSSMPVDGNYFFQVGCGESTVPVCPRPRRLRAEVGAEGMAR